MRILAKTNHVLYDVKAVIEIKKAHIYAYENLGKESRLVRVLLQKRLFHLCPPILLGGHHINLYTDYDLLTLPVHVW